MPAYRRRGNEAYTSCFARPKYRLLVGLLAGMILPAALSAHAQDQPPQGVPPGGYQPLTGPQLDQLVAPIALYPDSLVAQVLAASTYPDQVTEAQQFMRQNQGVSAQDLGRLANTQPWDPSVKALVAFPRVLSDLNQNMSWTTQLGNAYYNQPHDVMGAVQGMRQRAYAAGTLRSSPQLAVTYDPGNIVIAPADPAVVYVPSYNPWAVYGAPVPVYASYNWGPPPGVAVGVGIGFGGGVAIGAFAGFGWGFHAWAPNWGGGNVAFNNSTYISNSTTVINHGRGFNPGGPMIPNHGTNPGGPMIPNEGRNPGGPMIPNHGTNPGGPMIPNQGRNPGGPMIPNHNRNPGGPMRNAAHRNRMARPAQQKHTQRPAKK